MRKVWMAAVVGSLAFLGCQDRSERVQEERKDVAEAQQKASENIAEARQEAAQERTEIAEDLNKETAEARQDVAEEQKDVREAEYEGRELAASGILTGTLSDADDDSVTIEDDAGNKHDFKAMPNTRVMWNGKSMKLGDLEEGSEVRASYATENNEKVVRELTITASEKMNEQKKE